MKNPDMPDSSKELQDYLKEIKRRERASPFYIYPDETMDLIDHLDKLGETLKERIDNLVKRNKP